MNKPIFSFGVVADIQYADHNNIGNLRLREVPDKLRAAVADWNQQDLAFSVQLGDVINGNADNTHHEFSLITSILAESRHPIYHVIGNHCLSVALPELLAAFKLTMPYYAFVHKGFRFISLYGMDVSIESAGAEKRAAEKFLAEHPTMREWCGAISDRQLAWLDQQLSAAAEQNERVIIFCHFPAHWNTTDDNHGILWNYQEIARRIISSNHVVAYLNGHFHKGSDALEHGVHFVSFEAMVEAPQHSNAYGVVDVYSDKLIVRGVGALKSRILMFR